MPLPLPSNEALAGFYCYLMPGVGIGADELFVILASHFTDLTIDKHTDVLKMLTDGEFISVEVSTMHITPTLKGVQLGMLIEKSMERRDQQIRDN